MAMMVMVLIMRSTVASSIVHLLNKFAICTRAFSRNFLHVNRKSRKHLFRQDLCSLLGVCSILL